MTEQIEAIDKFRKIRKDIEKALTEYNGQIISLQRDLINLSNNPETDMFLNRAVIEWTKNAIARFEHLIGAF